MYSTPKEIVAYLDSIIVNQGDAKKTISIALRNRYRLTQIQDENSRSRIKRKNVLFVGPTGVGKTEIVTLACALDKFPFIKVDATRFTEVGYVGSDVETMISDLIEKSILMQKSIQENRKLSQEEEEKIYKKVASSILSKLNISPTEESINKCIDDFKSKKHDDIVIEIQVPEKEEDVNIGSSPIGASSGMDIRGQSSGVATLGVMPFGDFLKAFSGHKEKVRRLSARKAFEDLIEYEQTKDSKEELVSRSLKNAQQNGVIFIDEIDKLINNKFSPSRGDVSREGVQRDLLPLLEGTVVQTKYGPFDTKHVLFVSAGAFHSNKPTDLLSELQGRFPIRVKLNSLSKEDFIKILNIKKYGLLQQAKDLLIVDGIKIIFTECGVDAIAQCSVELNSLLENIGARRLYGVIENVIEEISFEVYPEGEIKDVTIDSKYVREKMSKHLSEKENKKENFII